MSEPRISVVIPCHNGGLYLGEAIESVLAQEGPFSIERVVVVDDRSSDPHTRDELARLGADPRVLVVASDHAPGPGGARNAGVARVTTEWLSFLDADDVLQPGAFAARVAVLTDYPDAAYIGADFQLWWPESDRAGEPFAASRPVPAALLGTALASGRVQRLPRPVDAFVDAALTLSGTLLLRTALFRAVGGYIESIRYCEDHHLLIKLARVADYHFVPRPVMLYRQHEGAMTNVDIPESEHYLPALYDLLGRPEFAPHRAHLARRAAEMHRRSATWERSRTAFGAAARHCLRGLRLAPGNGGLWRQLLAAVLRRG